MPDDPNLGPTYQIELEIEALRDLRTRSAITFGTAALEFWQAEKKGLPVKAQNAAWEHLQELGKRYETARLAVEAFEKHHVFSHVVEEVRDFMAYAERARREQSRFSQDDKGTERDALLAILNEIRAIRDKVDPPTPVGLDASNARRELNARRDGFG